MMKLKAFTIKTDIKPQVFLKDHHPQYKETLTSLKSDDNTALIYMPFIKAWADT